MKTLNLEAYFFSIENIGLKEIKGPENNRLIELSHYLTKISGPNPQGVDVDSTIPWCSSWMNLCFVVANMRANPRAAIDMLTKRKIVRSVIDEIISISQIGMIRDTQKEVIEPTWSAASKSWDQWGEEIPFEQARRGDVVRLIRDGGGHVAFLDEDELGTLSLRILGGNQSDMVCSSNRYMKSRLVTVRRAKI
jgi:hypothetical protein